MRSNKLSVTLLLLLLLGNGVAVAADFEKGIDAAILGDFQTALPIFFTLAQQGHADAQHVLGKAYFNGDGVLEVSSKSAVKWYTKAAEQGHDKAQMDLAMMYDYGMGVQENNETAVSWYTKSADQGNAKAQYNLGVLYVKGEDVSRNEEAGVKLITSAAEQGYPRAQASMGAMYAQGLSVLKDDVRAYMWFYLATYNGSKDASQGTELVAKEMSPAQIVKAQGMSRRCLASDYTDC